LAVASGSSGFQLSLSQAGLFIWLIKPFDGKPSLSRAELSSAQPLQHYLQAPAKEKLCLLRSQLMIKASALSASGLALLASDLELNFFSI
jgi:hypothetical protein